MSSSSNSSSDGLVNKPGESRESPPLWLFPVGVGSEIFQKSALADAGSRGDCTSVFIDLDGEIIWDLLSQPLIRFDRALNTAQ